MSDRVADYLLTYESLLRLLQGMDGRTVFRLEGLPAEPVIVGVHHDRERRCVHVRISSPDHDVVSEGEEVPAGGLRVTTAWRVDDHDRLSGAVNVIRQRHDLGVTDLDALCRDRRDMLILYDALHAASVSTEAELPALREVFSRDYLEEPGRDPERLAYEQGWRDAQRQAALRAAPRRIVEIPDRTDWSQLDTASDDMYDLATEAGSAILQHVISAYEQPGTPPSDVPPEC